MYIIIVGLGSIGKCLTDITARDRHNVVSIDKREDRCKEAASEYDVITIVGDATSKSVLEDAGVSETDGLIITTSDDAANLMTAQIAMELGAKTVVSIVNEEDHVEMFKKAGVTIQENPNLLRAQHLYRMIQRPNIKDFIKIGNGKAEIFEVNVQSNTKVAGKTLSELKMGKNTLIIAIERDAEIIVPSGGSKILPGDIITIFTKSKALKDVEDLFG
jgi:trk system potassium uptake protein TrkA